MRVCLLDEQLTFCYLSVSRSLLCLPSLSFLYLKMLSHEFNLSYRYQLHPQLSCNDPSGTLVAYPTIPRQWKDKSLWLRRIRKKILMMKICFHLNCTYWSRGCIEALKAEYGTNPGHSGSAYVHPLYSQVVYCYCIWGLFNLDSAKFLPYCIHSKL